MSPQSSIWVDRLTRVTFLKADPAGLIMQDEWHVDFCADPPNPNPKVVDPREVYLTIRVRETPEGFATMDPSTPEMAVKAIDAVEQAEQQNDALEVETNAALQKLFTGVAAGLVTVAGIAA